MTQSKPANHYDTFSMALHWITAICIVIGFTLGPGEFGKLMHSGVDPATQSDIVWHESLGMLVLLLTFVRLVWLTLRPTRPQFAMPTGMRFVSRTVQTALWALMILLPTSALLALGSEGNPLTLLGGLRMNQIPLIAGSSVAELTDWGDVHKFLGDSIMWLAGLHAAAAIFHHLILKDGVLRSMLPSRK